MVSHSSQSLQKHPIDHQYHLLINLPGDWDKLYQDYHAVSSVQREGDFPAVEEMRPKWVSNHGIFYAIIIFMGKMMKR